jgi:hypothetical protein
MSFGTMSAREALSFTSRLILRHLGWHEVFSQTAVHFPRYDPEDLRLARFQLLKSWIWYGNADVMTS